VRRDGLLLRDRAPSRGRPGKDRIALIKGSPPIPRIHGILVQTPLPAHFDEQRIVAAIPPGKDVDGFHPVNVGRLVLGQPSLRPCTPAGIQEPAPEERARSVGKTRGRRGTKASCGETHGEYSDAETAGRECGGHCRHTGAPDIRPYLREADVVIAAAGKPGFITGEMLKPGCVVIDVGINRVPMRARRAGTGLWGMWTSLSASEVAGAITPCSRGSRPHDDRHADEEHARGSVLQLRSFFGILTQMTVIRPKAVPLPRVKEQESFSTVHDPEAHTIGVRAGGPQCLIPESPARESPAAAGRCHPEWSTRQHEFRWLFPNSAMRRA